jgi:hypothetical protein
MRIGVTERGKIVNGFDKFKDTAEIVSDVRNVGVLCVRGHHDKWDSKTILVRIQNRRRRDVVVPAAPIVPGNNDRGMGRIGTVTDGVDYGCDPRRSGAVVD